MAGSKWHGTHVAGIISACGNNNIGVSGVCWNTKLVSLRIFDYEGHGKTEDITRAITYAINNNIYILNYSGGGDNRIDSVYDKINNYKGILVAAAGNDGRNTDSIPCYPASYNLDNIISVASTDSTDTLATNSNYGSISVDLSAPGVSILSTYPGNRYVRASGTSMAAPQVTGTIALLKSYFPGATTEQLKWAILEGVDKISALTNKTVTGGRLNAYNSFLKLADYQFVQDRVVSGDFNGDGKDDIAGLYYYDNDTTKIKVWLSTGTGLAEPINWYSGLASDYIATRVNGRLVSGDFNGDGKDDLATMYDYGQLVIAIHTWKSSGTTLLTMQEWYRSGVYGY